MSEVNVPVQTSTPAASNTNTTGAPLLNQQNGAKNEVVQKEESKETPKKFKVFKENGQEYEVDEENYHRLAQKSFAAEKRMWEAKEARKAIDSDRVKLAEERAKMEAFKKMTPSQRFDAMLGELEENPEMSKEFRDKLEDFLYAKLKEDEEHPEIKKRKEIERENKRLKDQMESEKKAKEDAVKAEQVKQYKIQYQKTIVDALDMSGLPKNEWNVKHIADLMYNAAKQNITLTPEMLSQKLKEDRIDNVRAMSGDMATKLIDAHKAKNYPEVLKIGERLTEMFGEDMLNALRRLDLTMTSSSVPSIPEPAVPTPQLNGTKDSKPYAVSWDKYQDERKAKAEELQKSWKRG